MSRIRILCTFYSAGAIVYCIGIWSYMLALIYHLIHKESFLMVGWFGRDEFCVSGMGTELMMELRIYWHYTKSQQFSPANRRIQLHILINCQWIKSGKIDCRNVICHFKRCLISFMIWKIRELEVEWMRFGSNLAFHHLMSAVDWVRPHYILCWFHFILLSH